MRSELWEVLRVPKATPLASTISSNRYAPAIEAAAPALGVELILTPIHVALELVRAIDAFGCEQNGGMLVLPGSVGVNRELLIRLRGYRRLSR